RISNDTDPLADDESRMVRKAKDLPAAIVEPHANVEEALLTRGALADGRSRCCAACGTHQRSAATPPGQCSPEDPADQRADHRSAHWVPLLIPGGLPDPGDLT